MADKYADVKARICSVFNQHRGRYGYRRVTAALRQEGMQINHKTVQRLMGELRLKSCVRIKKYRSYKGEVGHIAPNLLARQFQEDRPNEKWVTDVTEFKVNGKKLYLSPVLDLYNGEIVAYEMSRRPLFEMVGSMLHKAFAKLHQHEKFHSPLGSGVAGRIQPVVATPLIEEVLHGSKCKAGVSVDRTQLATA